MYIYKNFKAIVCIHTYSFLFFRSDCKLQTKLIHTYIHKIV